MASCPDEAGLAVGLQDVRLSTLGAVHLLALVAVADSAAATVARLTRTGAGSPCAARTAPVPPTRRTPRRLLAAFPGLALASFRVGDGPGRDGSSAKHRRPCADELPGADARQFAAQRGEATRRHRYRHRRRGTDSCVSASASEGVRCGVPCVGVVQLCEASLRERDALVVLRACDSALQRCDLALELLAAALAYRRSVGELTGACVWHRTLRHLRLLKALPHRVGRCRRLQRRPLPRRPWRWDGPTQRRQP